MTFEVSNVTLQRQAVPPVGESKSDCGIVLETAEKLGMYDRVSMGKTIEEWIEHVFNHTGLVNQMSWEDFNKKCYFVYSIVPDWHEKPAGVFPFSQDPEANPLPTPSGKLGFYLKRIAEVFQDDRKRLPIPKDSLIMNLTN